MAGYGCATYSHSFVILVSSFFRCSLTCRAYSLWSCDCSLVGRVSYRQGDDRDRSSWCPQYPHHSFLFLISLTATEASRSRLAFAPRVLLV
ncbi:hypothetical protein EI94DRAFT_1747125 [Lactarius quietus]|nr:hypothetical protein EI94DRAFT_1747125 [Lactarius quietus]